MTTAREAAQHSQARHPDRQYAYSRDELRVGVYDEQQGYYRPILERRTIDTDWDISLFVFASAAATPPIEWVPL